MKSQVIFSLILILVLLFLAQISKADICNDTDIDFEVWIKADCEHGIFEIYNEHFITDISELPYSIGIPDKQIQKKGNIEAWIDIVGFRNLSKEDGKYFISGNPVTLSIIQYDVKGRPSGYVDEIKKQISFDYTGKNLMSILNVKMKWHVMICDKNSCWPVYHEESANFYDIEPIPDQVVLISDIEINISKFNNSFYQSYGIDVQNTSMLNEYTINYKNNSVKYIMKSAKVNKTEKGIYYAEIESLGVFEQHGKNISRFYGNMILVDGDLSEIKVTRSNLYGHKVDMLKSISEEERSFRPEQELYKPLSWVVVGTLILILSGLRFFIMRMIK